MKREKEKDVVGASKKCQHASSVHRIPPRTFILHHQHFLDRKDFNAKSPHPLRQRD